MNLYLTKRSVEGRTKLELSTKEPEQFGVKLLATFKLQQLFGFLEPEEAESEELEKIEKCIKAFGSAYPEGGYF